jgi:hypothetical protein
MKNYISIVDVGDTELLSPFVLALESELPRNLTKHRFAVVTEYPTVD